MEKEIPTTSGVYFVRLKGENLISVNDDRPSIRETSVKVNNSNCKYGRAVNLHRRFRDYQKTFGADRVLFTVLAVTTNFIETESVLDEHFRSFRMRGRTGRLNEWLERIDPDIALQSARNICRQKTSSNDTLPTNSNPLKGEPSTRLSHVNFKNAEPDNISSTDIVDAAEYLLDHDLDNELLRDMHHSPRRSETLNATIKYFARVSALQSNNLIYGNRLIFVAKQHRRNQGSFSHLVGEAIASIP